MLVLPYKRLAAVMKFVCLSLLVYVIVPFLTKQNPALIIKRSLIPGFHFDKDFLLIVTGLTGAIISPYLFFWQTTSEVERMAAEGLGKKKIKKFTFLLMRKDILSGAFFAVFTMYFIILTTGTILYDHGIRNINTIKEAALALEPLAGRLSSVLFSIGIIGTGFLIIPILSSSISYILTEAFNRESGLSKSPREAGLFYIIIAISMCSGIAMHWLRISPVKALLFTTILYGITAPFLIGIILHVCNNKKIMGSFCNSRLSNFAGFFVLSIMLSTLIVLGYFLR
jgi:Mn2+/Fe2+ NRAMP family transporter